MLPIYIYLYIGDIMFEITINGRTERFNTASEMEEFRQRMSSPKTAKYAKKKKKVVKPKKNIVKKGLSSFIRKNP